MFTYASMHRLRYGSKIKQCKIFNFLTGNVYTMDINDVLTQIMTLHIKELGNYCDYHVK